MSVKVMGRVWDLDLPPEEKFTLLALADHADHDGNNAHPGVELLAQKTGYSVRQIQYNLKKLRGRNLITPIESAAGGRGRQTTYQIFPERVQNVHPLTSENPAQPAPFNPQKGAERAPFNESKGCNPRQKRVQSTTEKGAIHDNPPHTPPNRKNHHEPSEEPSHTHDVLPLNTRLNAQPGCVCKSFYELEICIAYARTLPGIRTPVALGKTLWRDGTADSEIATWLGRGQREETKEERYARIFRNQA